MTPEKEPKTRRPRRSKADIEEAINKAAITQIKKKGFSLALVTDIVKRAKIEPIVFYNRYKNLDEFYDEFVKNYDYWLSDIIRDSVDDMSTEEGFSNIIEKLLNNLLNDEIMTELLRWEIAEGNHITERTARLRELHAIEMTNAYNARNGQQEVDAGALTALLVGGIYYMILHRGRSTMAGIDLDRTEGKRRVIEAIRSFAALLYHSNANMMLADSEANERAEEYRRRFEKTCRERVEGDYRAHVEELIRARQKADRERIANHLRTEGLSEEAIARVMR